ncbi:MAG: HlyD family efflux transporter periplasmic adaptor subunit [Gemmataceae bacterium]|nr:HlyD family efflux transporter periplasmic adaptor subunit [Gemmataceae bacterium]MDW8267241.1 HlyD family efflux transporter periplasmic adaptor subunit [Gemmataceae bacterium]
MTTNFNTASSVDANLLEQARRQVNRLIEEVARLSELDLSPANYYCEFLERVLTAIAAPAGAVWLRNPQGHLQLQYQVNIRQVGIDKDDACRQVHSELLRHASNTARPMLVPPHSGAGDVQDGSSAGNPTDYMTLIAPILIEKQVVGLVEVWQSPDRNPEAQRGFLQFMVRMAELASIYTRNQQLRAMVGQQQIWTQLEAFTRQIHGSLHPTEVSYLIVNEARRLIDCDRVSVATRNGKRTSIEAISGADVVEKRSNLVQLMRRLCDEVIVWGEKLTFTGQLDDSLPPKVFRALDEYLAESNSKLLVVLPLKDERQKDTHQPARAALVMESFEPAASPEQQTARLEVIARHATSALYNALEYHRIPMRFLWLPLARMQEGLGGKARFVTATVGTVLVAIVLMLIFVPYPLKLDAQGTLLPMTRRWTYSPVPATVVRFEDAIKPGAKVTKGQHLVKMFDYDLQMTLNRLKAEIADATNSIPALEAQLNTTTNPTEKLRIGTEIAQKRSLLQRKQRELDNFRERTDSVADSPGYFMLKAPIDGTILSWDFRETLTNRYVKPSDPLLRIGDLSDRWEIELKIPQKYIGQVLRAFDPKDPQATLDVDLLLLTKPTETFKGKLSRDRIAAEATPDKDNPTDSEPVVLVSVRIDGDDIPEAYRIPREYLTTSTEVHAKVRCGNRRMGYSLFFGLWEFFYEKVVFFF